MTISYNQGRTLYITTDAGAEIRQYEFTSVNNDRVILSAVSIASSQSLDTLIRETEQVTQFIKRVEDEFRPPPTNLLSFTMELEKGDTFASLEFSMEQVNSTASLDFLWTFDPISKSVAIEEHESGVLSWADFRLWHRNLLAYFDICSAF